MRYKRKNLENRKKSMRLRGQRTRHVNMDVTKKVMTGEVTPQPLVVGKELPVWLH